MFTCLLIKYTYIHTYNELNFKGNIFSFIKLSTIFLAVYVSFSTVINSKK